jgi:hypothetical protein
MSEASDKAERLADIAEELKKVEKNSRKYKRLMKELDIICGIDTSEESSG